MKVYEVEYRAVVTVVEQDLGKAALQGAALIRDNPHLLSVRAVHERNPASEPPGLKDSQPDSVVATLDPSLAFRQEGDFWHTN